MGRSAGAVCELTEGVTQTVELRARSYEDRHRSVPALLGALAHKGCWVEEPLLLSALQVELRFEMQLRSSVEVYSALIAAGLEMPQDSHLALTSLCTLWRHRCRPLRGPQTACVRLEVRFVDAAEDDFGIVAGLA